MRVVSYVALAMIALFAATSIHAFDLLGDPGEAPHAEAALPLREAPRAAAMDLKPDGSNLRAVLADDSLSSEVISITPRLTFFNLSMAGQRYRTYYGTYILPLCQTGWEVEEQRVDPLTDKKTMVWRKADSGKFYMDLLDSGVKDQAGIVLLRCPGVATWRMFRIVDRSSGINFVKLDDYIFVEHQTDQPFVWKTADIGHPDAMPLPPDGVIGRSDFGIQDSKARQFARGVQEFFYKSSPSVKPKPHTGIEGIVEYTRIIGWLARKCSAADGEAVIYRETRSGVERMPLDIRLIRDLDVRNYISCSSKSTPVFVFRTDNMAFRKGASYETLWK